MNEYQWKFILAIGRVVRYLCMLHSIEVVTRMRGDQTKQFWADTKEIDKFLKEESRNTPK